MIYLIEGPDRVGKSTFIDLLRSTIKNPYIVTIHCGKPPKDVDNVSWTKKHYLNLISRILNLNNSGHDIILDRSWIGEMVYGPLYRNTNIDLEFFETPIMSFKNQFKLLLFLDSAESLLSREDGNSHSNDLEFKTGELSLFTKSFDESIIDNKWLIDWSNHEFSKSNVALIVNNLLSGSTTLI